ncbi:MAG: amino acid adenylation domain-containing protein, partial [Acidobacteriota bacterium]
MLVLNLHHIICDGWSFGVLHRELSACYKACCAGVDPATAVPPLAVQYPDYALWQRDWLQGEALEHQLGYWLWTLEGVPEALDLPLRGPRPTTQTYRGAMETFRLSRELTEELTQLATATRGTLFLVLEAAFAELLGRYSGARDLCVGTPVANRRFAELEPLIGCFINTLVLRNVLEDHATVRERIDTLRGTVLDAFAHQDLPFERLVEAVNPARDASRSPIFQVMMVLQNNAKASLELEGLAVREVPQTYTVAKFDLSLYFMEDDPGAGLAAGLEYNVDLFEPALIRRMARQLNTLLAGFVAHPDRDLQSLSSLTAAERFQALREWNDTVVSRRPWPGLHDGFAEQARRTPGAVALVYDGQPTTYAGLASQAHRLALRLLEQGTGRETRVAILLPRSPALIAGLLGILQTGSTYVPLDPTYPPERLRFMLGDAKAKILVTSREALAASALEPTCSTIFLEELAETGLPRAASATTLPGVTIDPQQLAYLIYTSGSTGRPKAVAIEHRSATAMLGWAQTAFSFEDLKAVPAVSSVCFDLSVFEIFLPLSVGGTVYLADDALAIRELTGRENLTLIQTVPSVAAELVRAKAVPPRVKVFVLAGEPLPGELVRALHQIPSVERVCDLYGASEDTTHSTYTLRHAGGPQTVGRPFDNRRLNLLNAALRPVPTGAVAEVHLGGAGLARCYLSRPGLTAERFVPDPYSGEAGERIYRTGDLGRVHENGEIQILGRRDHQVKIRGFRIEMGEIEARLSGHEGIEEACVLVDVSSSGSKRLVAAVRAVEELSSSRDRPDAAELRQLLAGSLPEYMIPSAIVVLSDLPKNPNGKTDRRALLRQLRESRGSKQGYAAPRSQAEKVLSEIWSRLLGRDPTHPVGVDENFFEIGGDSILVLQMTARAIEAGLAISTQDVFR